MEQFLTYELHYYAVKYVQLFITKLKILQFIIMILRKSSSFSLF